MINSTYKNYNNGHEIIDFDTASQSYEEYSEESLLDDSTAIENQEGTIVQNSSSSLAEKVGKIFQHTVAVADASMELASKGLEILGQTELQAVVDGSQLVVKGVMGVQSIVKGQFNLNLNTYATGDEKESVGVLKSYFSLTSMTAVVTKGVEFATKNGSGTVGKVYEVFHEYVNPLIGKVCKDPAMLLSNCASLQAAYSLPENTEEEMATKQTLIAKYALKASIKGVKVTASVVAGMAPVMASPAVVVPLAVLGFGVGLVDAYTCYQDIKKDIEG